VGSYPRQALLLAHLVLGSPTTIFFFSAWANVARPNVKANTKTDNPTFLVIVFLLS
jgi:hypothetical protein